MNVEKSYKLLSSPNYSGLRISGPVGIRPDTGILSDPDRFLRPSADCVRTKLPPYIGGLEFTDLLFDPKKKQVRSVYFLSDFMIVNKNVLDFLFSSLNGKLDYRPVIINNREGGIISRDHFAAKPTLVIDCIDEERSLCRTNLRDQSLATFKENAYEIELTEQCSAEYANYGNKIYRSYPYALTWVRSIKFKENSLRDNPILFQPRFWPSHLIGSVQFLEELERRHCTGGTPGYYFWKLDLDDIIGCHHRTSIAMR